MSGIIEKRKSVRIKAGVPLQYRELRGNTYLAKGTLTRDLSEGGVRFVTDKFIGLTCHLILDMQLPFPFMTKSIKAISKPAWVRKIRHGADYEIGSQFLALTSEDTSLLSDFIKSSS